MMEKNCCVKSIISERNISQIRMKIIVSEKSDNNNWQSSKYYPIIENNFIDFSLV
jgi:hypothetical protein